MTQRGPETAGDDSVPSLSWSGTARGVRDLLPASVAVLAFGIGFGAAAVERGLQPVEAVAMSALVFAGASQFAALELWREPMPWLALIVTTLAVNARHLVLGATLGDLLGRAPPGRRYAVLALLSDANWAATRQAAQKGERDLGHLLGGGLMLWASWVAGGAVGALVGDELGDLRRLGLDALLPAFFVSVLASQTRGVRDLTRWFAAAALTLILARFMAGHWAVILGAALAALPGSGADARN